MVDILVISLQIKSRHEKTCPGPEVIKKNLCSTQLSTKFILLINVKMATIVGILTLMSRIMTVCGDLNLKFPLISAISVSMSSLNFMLS